MAAQPLAQQLAARAERGRPLRVGLIGAGKFGTMFLVQARRLKGLHVLGVADLAIDRARSALKKSGWSDDSLAAADFDEALAKGTTRVLEDGVELAQAPELDVLIEATGAPRAGVTHVLKAFDQGVHVVMVNVEADALIGPQLARRAEQAGVVYSLAYGDQPALICELIDWAAACALPVVCAGKGTKYLPEYRHSSPETVWDHYGFDEQTVRSGDFNAQMYNSFLDGTKSAIEMASVANAKALRPQAGGLYFPAAGATDLANVCRPQSEGGQLEHVPTVEVVSSLNLDGSPVPQDLRWGVFVVVEAGSSYAASSFAQYGLATDETGRYAGIYRPHHLAGLELSVSVLHAGLEQRATGTAAGFLGDVAAAAKRPLRAGEVLDGEGGYCVYGHLLPAERAIADDTLPIGLAKGLKVKRAVGQDELVRWSDVYFDERDALIAMRREMQWQSRP